MRQALTDTVRDIQNASSPRFEGTPWPLRRISWRFHYMPGEIVRGKGDFVRLGVDDLRQHVWALEKPSAEGIEQVGVINQLDDGGD
jgi:hypothetical protein